MAGQRDWFDEHRFEVLMLNPLVRSRIDRFEAIGGRRITGPYTIRQMSHAGLGGAVVALVMYANFQLTRALRLRTTRSRAEKVPWPVGQVIVAVACSFADRGQRLTDVRQDGGGCVLTASTPLGAWSRPGTLEVSIHRSGPGSLVEARTNIPGQYIDLYKGKRVLNGLYSDIPRVTSMDVHL